MVELVGTRMVRLGDVTVKARTTDPAKSGGDEFTYVDLSSVDQSAKLITDARVLQSQEAPSRARQVVAHGDVLVATVRPNLNGVAKVCDDLDGAIASTGFTVLRPDPAHLEANYLFHWVKSQSFVSDMVTKSTGASYPAVSDRIVKESRIPLPPLDEQRRIAAILDKADELRTKRRQALAHLDTLTQSIFHTMFGSGVPSQSVHPIVKIRDVLESAKYGTGEKATTSGDVPVLRMGNLTYGGRLDLADLKYVVGGQPEKYLLRNGDVLFNRTNSPDLVGKTAVFRGSDMVAYAGYLVRLRTSREIDPEYLVTFMNLPSTKQLLRNMCKSIVGMANINAQEVQSIRLPLPPLELQQTFANRVAAVERLKESHRKHLAELDTLFASLQHRAFRGEL